MEEPKETVPAKPIEENIKDPLVLVPQSVYNQVKNGNWIVKGLGFIVISAKILQACKDGDTQKWYMVCATIQTIAFIVGLPVLVFVMLYFGGAIG